MALAVSGFEGATGVASRIASIEARVSGLDRARSSSATFGSVLQDSMDQPMAASTSSLRRSVGGQVALAAGEWLRDDTVSVDPGDGGAELVGHAFRSIGIDVPDTLADLRTQGAAVDTLDEAQPGDLLVFDEPTSSVAVYAGSGRMVTTGADGRAVVEDTRPPTGIRRIVAEPLRQSMSHVAQFSGLSSVWSPPPATSAHQPTVTPDVWTPYFEAAGAQHGIDPNLLMAVAEVESAFDPTAVSHAGAQGMMQFMPATAAAMGVDPFDPPSAIDGAARYLTRELDRFGSIELAIAAYNAGGGAVQRHGGIPPYPETQNYVRKVLAAWESRT